jgi:phosphoribosylpyrophosphate synthetase
MSYRFHKASYNLGDRELTPEERVVVGTRPEIKEARRVAKHLGLHPYHPEHIIRHTDWQDGEYLPTFLTAKCLKDPDFARFKPNYFDAQGKPQWGFGLRGKVVYIVHTFSSNYDPQSLDMRVFEIADTAKYNGAEAVVLLAYTLDHSAQERGVHDIEHERMRTDAAREKADGQAPISRTMLKLCTTSGIDAIVVPDNHCPDDTRALCAEVNNEYAPMSEHAKELGLAMRYRTDFVHIDLAPMLGAFIARYGASYLGFDISDGGKNVMFMSPDLGAAPRVKAIRARSGLVNSAFAVMSKTKDVHGNIETLRLVETENLPGNDIEGKCVFIPDDAIRSGGTMKANTAILRGKSDDGKTVRDESLKGTPAKVVVYATRTNFAGISRDMLAADVIDYIVITNSDPRGLRDLGKLDQKTFQIWINFLMADAARCVERGDDPNKVLTPEYMEEEDLIKIEVPHGNNILKDRTNGRHGIF